MMIGREKELLELKKAYEAKESQLVAIYGVVELARPILSTKRSTVPLRFIIPD